MTCWNLFISDKTDRLVRSHLARIGMKKGDLSKFVDTAVRACESFLIRTSSSPAFYSVKGLGENFSRVAGRHVRARDLTGAAEPGLCGALRTSFVDAFFLGGRNACGLAFARVLKLDLGGGRDVVWGHTWSGASR